MLVPSYCEPEPPVLVTFTVLLKVLVLINTEAEFKSSLAPIVAELMVIELPIPTSLPLFIARVPVPGATEIVPEEVSVKPPKSSVPRLRVKFVIVRTVSKPGILPDAWLMVTLSPLVGTPFGLQFVDVFQSVEVVPVQVYEAAKPQIGIRNVKLRISRVNSFFIVMNFDEWDTDYNDWLIGILIFGFAFNALAAFNY